MKISNLKIFDSKNNLIQNIDFELNGISYVLGDIIVPNDQNKTSNSIGKTLLLKLIDYIFGANEDKSIVKEAIHQYRLVAKVVFNNNFYTVQRTLGVSNSILIDDVPKNLDDYKTFFGIERNIISRQIVLQRKQHIISALPHPNIEDYKSVLSLLGLNEICSLITKIKELQNEYSSIDSSKNQIISVLEIDSEKVNDEIFFNEKEIDELTNKIKALEKEIAALRINSENTSLQDEFSMLNNQVKVLRSEKFDLTDEQKSLEKFIIDSNSSTLDGNIIKKIYKKAKIELPDSVVKSLEEVDSFYKSISEDRLLFAKQRINDIKQRIAIIESEITKTEARLDAISDILSMNDAYKNAIEILHDFNINLQSLKYKQGQLSQISSCIAQQEDVDKQLLETYAHLQSLKASFEEIHKAYKNFVFDIVRKIYDQSVRASFEIALKEYSKKNYPIGIQMDITGDSGEGVSEVKKVIMDYLLFSFNNYVDVFVHDSSCYNGVDPRQVRGLLQELDRLCEMNQKQVIVSINKYQVGDSEFLNMITDKACITLSEKHKLFKFNF